MGEGNYVKSITNSAAWNFATIREKALRDSQITIRIVGEYSAGKTRLVNVLLGHFLPKHLLPISSMEVQTRLPLEITFDPKISLSQISREDDYKEGALVRTLDRFPTRAELHDYDPHLHRLRLTVPEKNLILKNGDPDSDEHQAERLFLIDTPGWNSNEDEIAELDASEMLLGERNLAIVYVVDANRVDGRVNRIRLENFIQAILKAEFVWERRIVAVITKCLPSSQTILREKLENKINDIWTKLNRIKSNLDLEILTADFGNESSSFNTNEFIKLFWNAVSKPILRNSTNDTLLVLANGKTDSAAEIVETFTSSSHTLAQLHKVLKEVCINGRYLGDLNRSKLLTLDPTQIQLKAREILNRQLGDNFDLEKFLHPLHTPELADHELSELYNGYFKPYILKTLGLASRFFKKFSHCINELPSKREIVQEYLDKELTRLLNVALSQYHDTRWILIQEIANLAQSQSMNYEKLIATIFSLSIYNEFSMRVQHDHVKKES